MVFGKSPQVLPKRIEMFMSHWLKCLTFLRRTVEENLNVKVCE